MAAAVMGYAPEVKPVLAAAGHVLGTAWRLRTVLLIGLGVGVLTAAVAYVSSPAVSAAIGGVGGVAAALAVQGAVWVRRMARGMGFGVVRTDATPGGARAVWRPVRSPRFRSGVS